jgi:hypothetical protein
VSERLKEGAAVVADGAMPAGRDGSVSTSDLVSLAATRISTLVRDELALAKVELVFAVAGVAALLGKKQLSK